MEEKIKKIMSLLDEVKEINQELKSEYGFYIFIDQTDDLQVKNIKKMVENLNLQIEVKQRDCDIYPVEIKLNFNGRNFLEIFRG